MSDRLERAWRAIDPQRLRTTLLDLLDIYSPSGKEEDVQLYLEERLTGAGFTVERQEVEEDRYNLRVTMGEAEPRLSVRHIDRRHWDRGLRAEQRGSSTVRKRRHERVRRHGRAWLAWPHGMGGGAAAGGGEVGMAPLSEAVSPPWVVIGEPTSLVACFAHYGYLEAGFVTRGRRIHSSLPELGHNAVESMLRVLLHLGRDPLFAREASGIVYSIREMSSARAGFVVPDRCESWIDLHLPPEADPDPVAEAIRRRAAGATEYVPDLNLEVAFDFAARGYSLGTDNPLAARLREIYPKLGRPLQCDAFRSHSDGNLFFEAGVPTHPVRRLKLPPATDKLAR
jgi:acetylornithine deacetylase